MFTPSGPLPLYTSPLLHVTLYPLWTPTLYTSPHPSPLHSSPLHPSPLHLLSPPLCIPPHSTPLPFYTSPPILSAPLPILHLHPSTLHTSHSTCTRRPPLLRVYRSTLHPSHSTRTRRPPLLQYMCTPPLCTLSFVLTAAEVPSLDDETFHNPMDGCALVVQWLESRLPLTFLS